MVVFLDFVNIVAILALAIWLVMRLRGWIRSDSGREHLLTWRPAVFISAQVVVAFIWLAAAVMSPWAYYYLHQAVGGWSVLPNRFIIAALFILVPAAVVVVDTVWLRLHTLPPKWTLPRIWATAIVIWVAAVLLYGAAENVPGITVFAFVALFANLLTTLFLTVWWFFSHPLQSK
jgi:hypothetical protein